MDSFSLDRIMYLFDDLILHLQKIKFVTFFSGKKCFAFLFWNCEVITFWQYLWSFSSLQAFDFIYCKWNKIVSWTSLLGN